MTDILIILRKSNLSSSGIIYDSFNTVELSNSINYFIGNKILQQDIFHLCNT